MFTQTAIPIKSSTSLLYNNLDVLVSADGRKQYAVVHKSNVWVFDADEIQSNQAAYRRVVCKGESSQASSVIMQVDTFIEIHFALCYTLCYSLLAQTNI